MMPMLPNASNIPEVVKRVRSLRRLNLLGRD
jgi:hypothetical protein